MKKKDKYLLITTLALIPSVILPTTIACSRHQHNGQGFIADYLQDIRDMIKDYLEWLKKEKENGKN